MIVCINDEPGWLDGSTVLIYGREYTVLGYHGCDIFINDGCNNTKCWHPSRFIKSYSRKSAITDLAKNFTPIKESVDYDFSKKNTEA